MLYRDGVRVWKHLTWNEEKERSGMVVDKLSKSRKKKWIYGMAAVCLALVLCTACGVEKIEFEQPQENAELSPTMSPTADWAENTLFTVDGKEVDYREALLMLLAAKEEAEILYGKGIWDYTLDEEGTTYAMLRKEQVLEELINTHVACLHAAELGVDIYEEENRDIAEYTSEFIENVGRENLLKYNLTEALIKQIYRNNTLALKVYESITLSVDTDIADDAARQMKIQYIFKDKYTEDENGERVLLPEEELTTLRTKVQELRDTGMGKDNFASYAELNTDAKDGVTKTIGAGDFPAEIERIIMGLKDGEFSPVLETEAGFYVVKCVLAFDEDATAARKEEMIVERQDAMFAETFNRWKEQAEIVVNEEKWAALQP